MSADPSPDVLEGRRARKARETRARIATVALKLMLERGYDATTLDDIAEAADISRRTFFHYFPSKEAILQAVEDDAEAAFSEGLAVAADQMRPLDAVEQALTGMVSRYASEEAIAIDALMRSTDALRARKQANYERQEQALFAALRAKWPDPMRAQGLRIVAMAGIGAKRIATDRWRDDPAGEPLTAHITRAFSELRDQLERR
jgi:AcrR family transcriptional regulator